MSFELVSTERKTVAVYCRSWIPLIHTGFLLCANVPFAKLLTKVMMTLANL